ncbi:hypothetical protein SEVIR_4G042500v4 [Setaria viridis]|uniref:Fe2OG dioxygenase domain-containing protein n=1 Tax=Setaria viridis TaxID=4556 RepID=A0A4U6UWB0_SETVI|nr:flavanone 3-dioxygenase 3-like [Setaria viridis]TKW19785.1 hypothetical protein SEVIR_4G042500v2 [Setaria viridis]
MDSAGDVPIIDLSKLRGTSSERSAAVQDVGRVCQEKGFFQVINHGISTDILRNALAAAAAFFSLPMDDRSALASDDITLPVRYVTSSSALDGGEVKVHRHVLKQYSYPLEKWIGNWPAKPSQYREKMGKYAREVRNKLVSDLMEAITESLGLGRYYLSSQMENGFEMMLLSLYPPPPVSSGSDDLRCGDHTDYTFISVILSTHEGLEELDRVTGAWLAAPHRRGAEGGSPPPPPSLTVHVGDCLEAMSNGRYRAAVHRVLWGRGDTDTSRVSITSLTNWAMDESVEVAKELVDDRHPTMYKGSTLRDYTRFLLAGRASGSTFLESLKIN